MENSGDVQVKVQVEVLDNGNEYLPIKKTIINSVEYLFLVNIKDSSDKCIRKVVIKDGEEYLSMLETEQEFETVMKEFEK